MNSRLNAAISLGDAEQLGHEDQRRERRVLHERDERVRQRRHRDGGLRQDGAAPVAGAIPIVYAASNLPLRDWRIAARITSAAYRPR